MNFLVENDKDYGAPFPRYVPPIKIGHFSSDSENKFHDDDHQMKYLSMPKKLTNLHLDLNDGYDKYVGIYNDEEDPYNKILRWIVSHKEEIGNLFALEDSRKKEFPFICHRSALLKIMTTMDEKFDDWMIYATKFRSVIYLCKIETEKEKKDEASLTDNSRRMISWGYKFEQYITSDYKDSKPNTSLPVNVNEKYFVVMKGKLENHDLLFSGETDAVDPEATTKSDDSKSMSRFVEIKTNYILDERKKNIARQKLIKWYLQSFIAGIPRVICGFKNRNGIVKEIKIYDISELPEMIAGKQHPTDVGNKLRTKEYQSARVHPYKTPTAKPRAHHSAQGSSVSRTGISKQAGSSSHEGLWSSDVCLKFASRFLSFVKQHVVKDDPKVVYKFYWTPERSKRSAVTCEELSPEYQFLPQWYIKEMSTL